MSKHEVNLGQLPRESDAKDAIHIAVIPMTAAVRLTPGQNVGFANDERNSVGPSDNPFGIVDPFLYGAVPAKSRCWILLYPQTITSLRHEWTHPAFIDNAEERAKEESRIWMENFAKEACLDFEEVLDAGREYLRCGDYLVQYDQEAARDAGYKYGSSEFWKHFEALTGQKVPDDDKDTVPFSCSC